MKREGYAITRTTQAGHTLTIIICPKQMLFLSYLASIISQKSLLPNRRPFASTYYITYLDIIIRELDGISDGPQMLDCHFTGLLKAFRHTDRM